MLATQKALPWGGRREDGEDRQASVGKEAAVAMPVPSRSPLSPLTLS